jgi:hypothetical protein
MIVPKRQIGIRHTDHRNDPVRINHRFDLTDDTI